MSSLNRFMNNELTFKELSYTGEKSAFTTTVGTWECNLQSVDDEYKTGNPGLSKSFIAFIFVTGLPIKTNQQAIDKDGNIYTVKGTEEYVYGSEIDHIEVSLVRGKATGNG